MNRIEKVKEILLDIYEHAKMDKREGFVISKNYFGRRAQEICQLFLQPLDDKELREKIARELYELRVAGTIANWFKWEKLPTRDQQPYYDMADGLLALLQPKIEEARRQEREMVMAWGDERVMCKHLAFYHRRKTCEECWQALIRK